MLTGTIINSLTILAGSAVGLVLRAVTRRSSKEVSADGLGGRLQTIIMQGMALCVLYIGVSGCLKGQNTLTAILSIALGAIIGELLDLDRRMRSLGGLGPDPDRPADPHGGWRAQHLRRVCHRFPAVLRGGHGHRRRSGKWPYRKL